MAGSDAPARSTFAASTKRERLPWPAGQPFRILSIDGGGIKGIYPAAILAGIERQLLQGKSVGRYFDLVAGTSTGGILALGLAHGHTAGYLLDLYMTRGKKIFVTPVWRRPSTLWNLAMYKYRATPLRALVTDALQDTTIRQSQLRLCIPSFEARHSEVAVLRTPHHPTCTDLDADKTMVEVAMSTSAAPSYFKPNDAGGYRYVDGGVWANNPTMIALVEALTCWNVEPSQIRILSLGCGRERYHVGRLQAELGGLLAWRKIMFAAMHLQAENAVNQARLMVGPKNFLRLEPELERPIALDDWARASTELPPIASEDLRRSAAEIQVKFLEGLANPPHFFDTDAVPRND